MQGVSGGADGAADAGPGAVEAVIEGHARELFGDEERRERERDWVG